MLNSVEKIINVALPDAVYRYFGRESNDREIKKTTVIKEMKTHSNAPRQSLYYQVHLQNGNDKEFRSANSN